MFSGIIEQIGRIASIEGGGASIRLTVEAEAFAASLASGDSVAVDGVCLTVEKSNTSTFSAYVSPETLARTALGEKNRGAAVNLERALPASGRLNGHIVQGHVDGVGETAEIRRDADSWRMGVRLPEELMRFCVEKGSIAIDGVSLTIADLSDEERIIRVAVIPFTFEHTTLSGKKISDKVNIETDILAKYAMRYLMPYKKSPGLTEDALRRAGFIV
ncbi:MAG TPA: riboflavin synthase [Candidatus Sumerlaeota bacterium]|nr:MAG: Riboflavin synthase [candidate division BRC1 bacterium ADurb.Bin183]HOE62162.1 riboflavin synthase [Candidatus Sumerlaeota bacterium]HRR30227.1 riboflavin synthase [Candidatus Sumerlaeia bacterium]HON49077.1 riboflavin synthase [Candidatus Sumerlaeota bacterium]HOR64316.1 riboflavin synthase [Candidatus Sumerlaeota bacterium]